MNRIPCDFCSSWLWFMVLFWLVWLLLLLLTLSSCHFSFWACNQSICRLSWLGVGVHLRRILANVLRLCPHPLKLILVLRLHGRLFDFYIVILNQFMMCVLCVCIYRLKYIPICIPLYNNTVISCIISLITIFLLQTYIF